MKTIIWWWCQLKNHMTGKGRNRSLRASGPFPLVLFLFWGQEDLGATRPLSIRKFRSQHQFPVTEYHTAPGEGWGLGESLWCTGLVEHGGPSAGLEHTAATPILYQQILANTLPSFKFLTFSYTSDVWYFLFGSQVLAHDRKKSLSGNKYFKNSVIFNVCVQVYLSSCLCILHTKLLKRQVCVLRLESIVWGSLPSCMWNIYLCGGQNSETVPKSLALVYTCVLPVIPSNANRAMKEFCRCS